MAQPMIIPVNVGLQAEATAGNQGATFTATDRKIIEERGGVAEKGSDFKALFMRRDLTTKVENEQTTVKQEEDIRELENRKKEHEKMLKHSTVINPHDKAEITGDAPNAQAIIPAPIVRRSSTEPVLTSLESVELGKTEPEKPKMNKETAKLVKELNLNPSELFDKFALEQEELHNLIYKIKELHLRRLLANDRQEFDELTAEIRQETLASGRPEAREWLSSQLDNLTKEAAEYKQKLNNSIKSIGLSR